MDDDWIKSGIVFRQMYQKLYWEFLWNFPIAYNFFKKQIKTSWKVIKDYIFFFCAKRLLEKPKGSSVIK